MADDVRLVRRIHGGEALSARVVRTVDVAVDPATAFEVFTAEIDDWYERGRYSWHDPKRAVRIRFEPGVGGRWIEGQCYIKTITLTRVRVDTEPASVRSD